MPYVVLFEDTENAAEIRSAHMDVHKEFLVRNATLIDAAGPLSMPDCQPAGGLWIVRSDSPEVVQALVEEDPFWSTGLRKSVRILHWHQVFVDGTLT